MQSYIRGHETFVRPLYDNSSPVIELIAFCGSPQKGSLHIGVGGRIPLLWETIRV